MRKNFDILAENVKTLSNSSKKNPPGKLLILNHLILAIHKFDDHLKEMIKEFPEYYIECKDAVDILLDANIEFLLTVQKEILSLSLSQKDN